MIIDHSVIYKKYFCLDVFMSENFTPLPIFLKFGLGKLGRITGTFLV